MPKCSTPVVDRLIRRLGRAAVRDMLFELERTGSKSAAASKYGIYPSQLTELTRDLRSVTLYELPPELLDYEDAPEVMAQVAHISEVDVYLSTEGVESCAPEDLNALLPGLPPEVQARVVLNPALRGAMYWSEMNKSRPIVACED